MAGGLVLGVLAGYFGDVIDTVVMRVMDVMFAFPFIVLAIVITEVLGPSLTTTLIAIGIVYLPICPSAFAYL